MHFWVNSAVENFFDDFTIEEGSIKRNIRMDLVNEEYYSTLKMDGGQFLAIIEAFQRNEVGEDDSFGSLLIGKDGTMRKSLGMASVETVVSMLNLSIRIQKYLEEEGIIDSNPANDKEDLNIYVDVEGFDIVARIIDDTSDIKLVKYKE